MPDDAKTFFEGVALASIGPARGHFTIHNKADGTFEELPVRLDEKTLSGLLELATAKENGVKVKVGHHGGVGDILGRVSNFRIDGDTLRADLTANSEHPDFAAVSWAIENVPTELGFSVMGSVATYEFTEDAALVRFASIDSFDLEPETATTPQGMFKQGEGKQLQTPKDMTPEEVKEAVAAAVTEAIKPIQDEVAEMKGKLTKLEEGAAPAPAEGEEKKQEEAMAKVAELAVKKASEFIALNLGITPPKTPAAPAQGADGKMTFEAFKAKYAAAQDEQSRVLLVQEHAAFARRAARGE